MISLTSLCIIEKYIPIYYICESNFTFADAATILIAIIALLFSFQQGYYNRKHNSLTVKPILQLEVKLHKNKIGISIRNVGNGPSLKTKMIIKDLNGKKINIPELSEMVRTKLQINNTKKHFQGITGVVIMSNDCLKILELQPDNEFSDDDYKTFFNLCKCYSFHLIYLDLYKKNHSEKEIIDLSLEDYLFQNRE